jgi:3D (Asp-Asp-Asp) domain-containing protein
MRVEQAQLAQRLDATKRTLAISQRQLGDNLAMLYKQEDVSALAVVLGSTSLDDAVTRLDDLNRVADQSRRVVAVTVGARSHLQSLRATFAARGKELRTALAAARSTMTSLAAARSDRLTFISSLRRERNVVVAKIEAAAVRVERKSNVLQAAALADTPVVSTVAAPVAASGRTITVSSTGYSLSGHTATGMPVGWGVVAVDPAVIPLGTRLSIPGYGQAVAADTGGAVRGNVIDIWFPTLAQAHAWGRRTVTITLH